MKRTSITSRTPDGAFPLAYARAGRVLVGFIAVLLIVMPWTEHLWHFDGLLVTGQDFEFGLLALASILSLVLVLSKHRAQTMTSFLAVLGWLSSNFQNAVKSAQNNWYAQTAATALPFRLNIPLLSSPALRIYNLPIQV